MRPLLLSAYCLVLSATGAFAAQAEELRDPFVFGSRTDEAATSAGPTLIGILWDVAHPLAMIGEETVGVGNTIGAWRVVDIKPDEITLQRGDRREILHPGDGLPRD